MRNELERTNTSLNANTNGMSKVANSASGAATAVFSINDGIKSLANAAGGIADIFSNAFSNTLSIIQEVSSEITALMVQAWTAADDWQSVADVYGGTAQDVQRLFTMANYAGFDTSSLTQALDKLIVRTHAGTEEFEDALKDLQTASRVDNLSEDNFDSHLDYFEAVVNALGQVNDIDERLRIAQSLFGDKPGAKFSQFLAKFGMATDNLNELEGTGTLFSQDEIDQLNMVKDTFSKIQTNYNQLKNFIGKELVTQLQFDVVLSDASNVLTDIMTLLGAKDEETKIEAQMKLSDDFKQLVNDVISGLNNFSELVQGLGEELSKSDDPIIKSIGNLIIAVSSIIEWLATNLQGVFEWLNADSGKTDENGNSLTNLQRILPLIEANLVSMALTGSDILTNVKTLVTSIGEMFLLMKAWKIAKNITPGAEGAANGGWLSNIFTSVKNGANSILPAVATMMTEAVLPALALVAPIAAFDKISNDSYRSWLQEDDSNVAQVLADWLVTEHAGASKDEIKAMLSDPDNSLVGEEFQNNNTRMLKLVDMIADIMEEQSGLKSGNWSNPVPGLPTIGENPWTNQYSRYVAMNGAANLAMQEAVKAAATNKADTTSEYDAVAKEFADDIAALMQKGAYASDGLTIEQLYHDLTNPSMFWRYGDGEEYDAGEAHMFSEAIADILEGMYGIDVQGYGKFESEYSNLGAKLDAVPEAVASAVASSMTGMKVVMDGTVVGQMVAESVSQQIAGGIYMVG